MRNLSLALLNSGKPLDLSNSILVNYGNSLVEGVPDGPQYSQSYYVSQMAPFSIGGTTLAFANSFRDITCANGAMIYNRGVGGRTTTELIANFNSVVLPLYDDSKLCICFIKEWLNDISVNQDTAAGHFARVKTLYNMVKNAGFIPFVATNYAVRHTPLDSITQAGDTYAVYYEKVLAVIQMILNDQDIPRQNKVRDDLIPELQDENDMTYFQTDGVHLKHIGYQLAAQKELNTILAYRA